MRVIDRGGFGGSLTGVGWSFLSVSESSIGARRSTRIIKHAPKVGPPEPACNGEFAQRAKDQRIPGLQKRKPERGPLPMETAHRVHCGDDVSVQVRPVGRMSLCEDAQRQHHVLDTMRPDQMLDHLNA
ncbi:hypothetical protein AYJ54_24265 [Bradyrhizobium centrolobii]|uniref:Uncharacterized protein n=2 Tax=Bradyrhizobium TaxID=374 RepID=A0A176YN35_9BRAD|nr:hypothetical protein AYJ54_24265 [Bradyrhizobium centrolobii]OAF07700.1 hypothetical protein AXW67_29545 [Bradyrhizobium neotropicale]